MKKVTQGCIAARISLIFNPPLLVLVFAETSIAALLQIKVARILR